MYTIMERRWGMDEWTTKTSNPKCRLFYKIDLLTDFAALSFTDFIDWRYIHSWFVILTQLVNCCRHGQRNYSCVLWPPYGTFSPAPPPPPLPNVQYIQTVCDCGGGGLGGVEMSGGPFSARGLPSVSDQIQNLQNCFTTPNKSKDDIKGLVSLKFLRPWIGYLRAGARDQCNPIENQVDL